MAWNGSGTFSRKVTTVSPATDGTTIDTADQNSYTADVTAGINACLAKNGENSATGDISLGSNQIKGIADGTLVTDAASVGQVQSSATVYQGTVTGTGDAILMTVTPTLTAYAAGQTFRFLGDSACTDGGVTIDIDGLGAKDIKTTDILDPLAGDINANGIFTIVYDGTRFILQNPATRAVGRYVDNSNGNPNISDTGFVIDTITVDTWETVGPTGTATNDWPDLDDLPDTIDWIEVKIYGVATIAAGVTADVVVYARDGTSTQVKGTDNLIFATGITATTGANSSTGMCTAKIPVVSKIFALRYEDTGSGQLVSHLTGYGWN